MGRKGMAMDLIPAPYVPTHTHAACLGGWLQYNYLSGFHPICLVCLFLAGPSSRAAWGQEWESRSLKEPGGKSVPQLFLPPLFPPLFPPVSLALSHSLLSSSSASILVTFSCTPSFLSILSQVNNPILSPN